MLMVGLAATAPAVRGSVGRAAEAAGGRLVGTPHEVKTAESLKRKISTGLPRDDAPVIAHLDRAGDILRYTVELDEADYTRRVAVAAAHLEAEGFHARPVSNAWYSNRYRGINSVWVHRRSGVAVEVQFHTPASWRATVDTHPDYEQLRLPDVHPAQAAALTERIAREFEAASRPGWVHTITPESFPPGSRPAPIEPVPDLTLPVVAAAGAGSHALVIGGRARIEAHRRQPQDTP